MEEMRATQEEQKRAGLLVDDAAPIKLSVHGSKPNATATSGGAHGTTGAESRVVFGQEDEEEAIVKKKRVPLVELDFVVDGEKAKEKLETLRKQVTKDKDVLWKAKVRWEAISDVSFNVLITSCELTLSPVRHG
jgi:RNA-binding protein 25